MYSAKCLSRNFLLFSFSFCYLLFTFISPVFAQSEGQVQSEEASLGVAKIVEVADPKALKDGMILRNSEKGIEPSDYAYDPQVVGVVAQDAAIVMNSSGTKNGVPVISQGMVYVLVSTKNGVIAKGDLITTSTIPGVGAKALTAGYVLGTALEGYSNQDPTKSDKIAVNLDLHYFNSKPVFPGSLTDILKFALFPTKEGPSPFFKYILAAVVALGSFVLGFMSFGRTAAKGVEALGRNPAASKIIHLGIIFNVGIVVVIVLGGLGVSFLILRL